MFNTYITEHCMKQVLLDNGWIVSVSYTNCPRSPRASSTDTPPLVCNERAKRAVQ